jgi:hypothetical protein
MYACEHNLIILADPWCDTATACTAFVSFILVHAFDLKSAYRRLQHTQHAALRDRVTVFIEALMDLANLWSIVVRTRLDECKPLTSGVTRRRQPAIDLNVVLHLRTQHGVR